MESRVVLARLRSPSHWPAKFLMKPCDFASPSMRVTCLLSESGVESVPVSAACKSDSSGVVLQRKYESRVASSYELNVCAALEAGSVSTSTRYKNFGDRRTARIASLKPVS